MWKEVDEARYNDQLNVMPPAIHQPKGFLVGEPWNDRVCSVTGRTLPTFKAFLRFRGKFYENTEPMTIPEFQHLNPHRVL